MSAPDLTQRETVFVQKNGTDDAGANKVGAPQSRLTIAAALSDLAANYPPATSTFFHIVAVGPGTFTEPGITLPPWTWINGSCDGEGQPTTILLTSADINLANAWNANATARGGLANVTIRAASGTPALDFTMPVPLGGNPARTVDLDNIRHTLTRENFQGTGTGDVLIRIGCIQAGANTDLFSQISGTSVLQGCLSAAQLQITDSAGLPAVGQWSGVKITAAGAFLLAQSTVAAGTTLALSACGFPGLHFNQTGAGVLAVTADTPSVPVRAAVTFTGSATLSNLTYADDAQGVGYSPGTPGNWPSVPVNVQQALDDLAGFFPAGGFIPYVNNAFVVVKTTGNAATNGNNLLTAYAFAVTLTPNGAALSATNRACVIVPPGVYDLGTQQLLLATQFVDLSGWSGNPGILSIATGTPSNAVITSTRNAANQGTINQTGSDIKVSNLTIDATGNFALGRANSDPAAYFFSGSLPLAVFSNCNFTGNAQFGSTNGAWPMTYHQTCSSTFLNCSAGDYSFGGGAGVFSGTATGCSAGNFSFGGGDGVFSGTATGCSASNFSFGGGQSGGGLMSGTVINCIGGFAAFGGNGSFSGRAVNCIGGSSSFGKNPSSVFSGIAINCVGDSQGFGFQGSYTASAVIMGCKLTSGTYFTGALLQIIDSIDGNGALVNFPSPYEATASGTAYSLTATPAALAFGTASPAIVLGQPGNYLIFGVVVVEFNAATFAVSRTVTLKLTRTNNTPGDLTNGSSQIVTGVVTGLVGTLAIVAIPPTSYSTALNNDAITIFGGVSVPPTAGSLDCTAPGTKLLALKI